MDSFLGNPEVLESIEQERAQLAKWCAWWYENRPDGEGETNLGILYQWVQVTNNDGKALATFFLRQSEGKLVGLEVALLRKGCQPNPYEQGRAYVRGWREDETSAFAPAERLTPHEIDKRLTQEEQMLRALDLHDDELTAALEDYRVMLERISRGDTRVGDSYEIQSQPYLTTAMQLAAARQDADFIPVTGVVTIGSTDGDTRFKFRAGKDGFTVRASKLGPILLKVRRAGLQHISLKGLNAALGMNA